MSDCRDCAKRIKMGPGYKCLAFNKFYYEWKNPPEHCWSYTGSHVDWIKTLQEISNYSEEKDGVAQPQIEKLKVRANKDLKKSLGAGARRAFMEDSNRRSGKGGKSEKNERSAKKPNRKDPNIYPWNEL